MGSSKLEILAYEETELGPLCLRRRELLSQPGVFVTEVTLNHEFLMSSYNTDSERIVASDAVAMHGGEKLSVLVGGLGLGYTAYELLRQDQVSTVQVMEYLPQVIGWLEAGLIPLSNELKASSKLQAVEGDVYQYLSGQPDQRFDLIVIDVDHSPDDQLDVGERGFYSATGLRDAKAHLKEGGVLAVWSYAESSAFSDALATVFANVTVRGVKTLNDLVGHEQTDWLFFGMD